MNSAKLDELRSEVDQIDRKILELLGKRYDVCRVIAQHKKESNISVVLPARINYVKESRVSYGAKYALRPEFVSDLYQRIIDEACTIEDDIVGD